MKQARYKEPLPLAVIEAARTGDAGAVEQVLQYYNGYINKLCTRTLYDDCGQLHVCVDEYMKHRLENKLIYAIVCNSRWEDGCLKPPAQQRIGNALYANTFLAIVQ